MHQSTDNVSGQLFGTRGEASFDWTIPDFLSLPSESGICRWSPSFSLADSYWHLQIFPNGETDAWSKGWIGLYLWRSDVGPPKTVNLTLGIRRADGAERILCNLIDATFTGYGPIKFLKRRELVRRESELMPRGELTITCTVRSDEQYPLDASLFQRLWNLSRCWKNVLDNEESTDVLLKLNGRQIRAHSLVLKTRSTVFQRMLASNMRRDKKRVIELTDEDEGTIQVALSYIYSGEPAGLDAENASAVYRNAHRYDLQELRKLCCMFIERNLSLDSVCDAFEMSDLYEENELKERAKAYFLSNVTEIVKTEKWKTFKTENPAAVSELLESAVLESLSRQESRTHINPTSATVFRTGA